jgi:hypothetical protein
MLKRWQATYGEMGRMTSPLVPPASSAPPLVRALRSGLLFRQPSLAAAQLPESLFMETAVRCDAADRAYRAAIEDVLAPADAREVLGTMSAFRAHVRDVRSAATTEIAALITRVVREPPDFDPLDVTAPRIEGLSHVDGVRLADLSDRARLRVDALRAEANARIAPHLSEAARDALAAAKRARVAAFTGAVHAELVPLAASLERFSTTVEALSTLADGWY